MVWLESLSEVQDWCNEIAAIYPELILENSTSKVELKRVVFGGGRLDGYFKDRFLRSKDLPIIPTLYIDNRLFMSVTPMEVESHQLHLKNASGNVLVGGLGMGYYLTQLKNKEDITSITVVEKDLNVINLYKKLMEHNPIAFASDKIKFVHSDIFDYTGELIYDYAYFDIWPSLDENEALEDTNKLISTELIQATKVGFWGMERWFNKQLVNLYNDGLDSSEVFENLSDILENECDFDLQWAKADMMEIIFLFGKYT